MIAIVDYGCGNLYSLAGSLRHLNIESCVTSSPLELARADKIILPGVGAFRDAIARLNESGLSRALCEEAAKGKYMLGICLGMQLLFDKSYEYGEYRGLGLIGGAVCPLEADLTQRLKVPHIGWNSLRFRRDDPVLKYSKDGDYMYFVHSYYAKGCDESILADAEYDVRVPGIVRRGNVYGMQFHPEKSGGAGLRLLQAFAEL